LGGGVKSKSSNGAKSGKRGRSTKFGRSGQMKNEQSYSIPPRNTEEYKDHGVNEFTESEKDAHSTFSIDVDTASFTIARKKLDSGTLPPLASVRAEEFINYFPYGYKSPKKDVFHIDMKAFSDPLRADHTYLRVGLQAKEFTKRTRPPLNLSFLVDVSGSMSKADKLPLAKESMILLLESLRPDDTISISFVGQLLHAIVFVIARAKSDGTQCDTTVGIGLELFDQLVVTRVSNIGISIRKNDDAVFFSGIEMFPHLFVCEVDSGGHCSRSTGLH
jgi:hypothetical protein